MTAIQQLESYLKSLERRLRFLVASKGAAAGFSCALALTLLFTWFANLHKFAETVVLPLRIVLVAAVAGVLTAGLIIPLVKLNRRRASRLAELRVPEFQERLITLAEQHDPANPFHELLAEDTLRVARENAAAPVLSSRALYGSLAGAVAALAVLTWMIAAGPGYWGYGASLLWTGSARSAKPLYAITVSPGDVTIRRRADQLISAQLLGFSASHVMLRAKYQNALKWEEIPMQSQRGDNGYQFVFAGLSDSLDYYVQAGDAQSKHFTVRVKDLPHVQRLRVGLHYPGGLGLKDEVQDPGGDIRAVQGTKANVSVLTDKQLEHGLLVFDDGSTQPLTASDQNWTKTEIAVHKDGAYHVAELDNGQPVRITDDYFIEAKKDEPPSVRILKPGADAHVSPIEEVPVTVEAADDFGVHNLELRYSVNGGPEQVKTLARSANAKEVEGKATLYLEDFKLAPGDLISFYAKAQDGSHESRSDIVFAQAEPFDFKFRQSQQAGGGGGGAGNQGGEISERQKEIIAATWNQLKNGGAPSGGALQQNAQFLAGLENKLGEQAHALSERMGNRELTADNPQFEEFSKSMLKASADMGRAAGELQPGKWNNALPPEQQALQSLLHAESIFREIQVSFGQSGGGGGGANGQERELSRLLDLELDRSKNQYETEQQDACASGQGGEACTQQQQKEVDNALQRLKDLAQRQQELAAQQRTPEQDFQQRWEQEQLRREAEQLRQQIQQLSQNSQSGSQQSQSPSGQQQGSSSSSSSSSAANGGQSSSRRGNSADLRRNAQSLQQAMNALRQAEQEMRDAVSNHDARARQRAADELAQAQDLLHGMQQQQAGNGLSELAAKGRELANNQKDYADRVKDLYGAKGIDTTPQGQNGETNGAAQMPEMSGPGYAGGYRRRWMPPPAAPATSREKNLAAEGEKLSDEAQRLQNQMQQQAQALNGEQPDATRKLRKALSDAEQQDLAVRMKKNAEWLREGYGRETWQMQDSVSAATAQLARQLEQAEQALNQPSNGKPGSGSSEDDKLAQALAEVRSLREQMQAGPEGQAGSRGQAGSGEQAGSGRQGGSDGRGNSGLQRSRQSGQQCPGGVCGDARPMLRNGGAGADQDAITQLNQLRAELGRNDRQLNSYLNDAIGAFRHAPGQQGLLDARINQDAVTSLTRLEVELQHRVEQGRSGVRTTAPESAPDGYRDAVASYFRTLSK